MFASVPRSFLFAPVTPSLAVSLPLAIDASKWVSRLLLDLVPLRMMTTRIYFRSVAVWNILRVSLRTHMHHSPPKRTQ